MGCKNTKKWGTRGERGEWDEMENNYGSYILDDTMLAF